MSTGTSPPDPVENPECSPAPLISVVIPAFNRAGSIEPTIRSVLGQTFRDFELIVVDDGSTDNTAEVLAPYLRDIRYIRQENKGITGARNTGLRAARGTWVALQDSDDLWLPTKLEQHVIDMQNHPGLPVYFVETTLQRTHLGKEVLSYEHSGFAHHLKESFTVIDRPLWHQIQYGVAWVQCTLVRRDVIERIGLYDDQLTIFTDYDLFCRLALEGPWGFNRAPLVRIQRLRGEKNYVSSQRTRTPMKAYSTMAYIMEKLASRPELNAQERNVVIRKLYASYSACGNVHWNERAFREARTFYAKAWAVRRRPAAAAKLLAASCAGLFGATPVSGSASKS